MPPILALFVCTIFVIFLLGLDRKQTRAVSYASWIPTIWMLLIATKALSIWFHEEETSDAEGSLIDRAVLSALLCFGLLILAKRKLDWHRVIRGNGWLVLLVGYAFLSIVWSDNTSISFRRWIREEFLAVVMAFVILSERDPLQAAESVLRRTTYILIPFSLLLIKYYPQYGVEYGPWEGELIWVGVTTQKNGLGRLCLIAIFFLAWTFAKRWRRQAAGRSKLQTSAELVLTVVAFWLLSGGRISTYSATAVVALAAGLLMLLSFILVGPPQKYLLAKAWGAVIALVFLYGAALPFLTAGGSVDTVIADALGRNQTFTGRTAIWAKLVPFFEQSPIFGYGFGGFWNSTTQMIAYGVKEAHNGYLALCLELGGVGLFLTGVFLAATFRKAQRSLVDHSDWGILCLGLLLMLVIHNISESSVYSLQRHLTATLLLASVAISVKRGDPVKRHRTTSGRANIAQGLDRSLTPASRNLKS